MESPYLDGSFAPVHTEHQDVVPVLLAGTLPRDLHGAYVRNGPNPRHRAQGRHHWFDGDGMLHALRFDGGEARYMNRWVRTPGLAKETEAGEALWRGLLESTRHNPDSRYKDTGNTDIMVHGGELLALHYMAGAAWRLDPRTLETIGAMALPGRLSAHAKVDPLSGDFLYFDYNVEPPHLSFGILRRNGEHHVHEAPVDGSVFPHDMAFTSRFGILMAPPVSVSAKHAAAGRWGVEEHADQPFRFILMPRDGGEARTFEASGCYVYHVVDAWDDGDQVELVAFRCPKLFPKSDPAEGALGVMMANLRLRATLHRWRFNLSTGETTEEALDDRNAEFPSVDLRRQGQGLDHAYAMTIPTNTPRLRFDGVLKYDVKTGAQRGEHSFGPGRTGSEASFAPRDGSEADDDGYLVSFVQDENEDRSEVVILDARTMEMACRLGLPHRVPLGFHACWAPEADS